jgi:serine/threonine-protein kinase
MVVHFLPSAKAIPDFREGAHQRRFTLSPRRPSAHPGDKLPAVATSLRRLGRYELVARIGEGGMAEVYLARQRGPRQFEKLVVVKVVHPQVASQPQMAAMLLDEARIAALVKHPNCVDIYDLGEEDGNFFIAMEYLEGESLAAILRASQQGPRLDPFSTAKIVSECAAGLHAAHELKSLEGEPLELVHQDVTPGNVFVLYTGQVKLVDFGVATIRTMGESDLVRGKAGYLAPELLDGARANRRTDVFALGVVLWEALTLRRLFWAPEEEKVFQRIRTLTVPPPSQLEPTVVRDLDEVCLKALERDPDKRFQTADAMRDEIAQILRHASWAGGDGPLSRYMQSTFAGRIKARQHLLREIANMKPVRSGTIERLQAIHDEPAPAPTPAEPIAVGAHGAAARPITNPTPEMVVAIEGTPTPPAKPKLGRALLAALLVAGGGAAAMIAFGGSSPSDRAAVADTAPPKAPAKAAVAPTPVPVPVPVLAPMPPTQPTPIPPPPGSGSGSASGAGSGSGSAEHHHHHDHPEKVATADPPPEGVAVTAKSLYKEGLQDFVNGDSNKAVDRFHAALAKDPSFAPAYRGMGMAYEREHDTAKAVAAYKKYLALAGDASDAAQIRTRLEGLQ